MTLADRKEQIFQKAGNISLCQEGCDLEYYNSTNKKAKCQCSPQIEQTLPSLSSSKEKFNPKNIADSFFSTLKNSNFYVLKCYKLAIDLKTLWINYGRILMTIILILSLIFLIIFGFCDKKNIILFLQSIINQKMNFNKNNMKKNDMKNIKKNELKNKNIQAEKIKKNNKSKGIYRRKKINKKSSSKKKKSINKKSEPPKRKSSHSNKNNSKLKLEKFDNSQTNLKDNSLKKKNNKNKKNSNKNNNKKVELISI